MFYGQHTAQTTTVMSILNDMPLESNEHTIVKDRDTLYGHHTAQTPAVVKMNKFWRA